MSAGEPRVSTDPPPRFAPGTFAPRPTPAPPLRRILATAGFELRLTLRNSEQLLLAVLIPVGLLIGSTLVTIVALPEPRVDAVLPGVLALAVLSTAFTSQAIVTAFDRRYGVLRRLAAVGMSRGQLLAGKCLAALAVIAGQFAVLGVTAALLGWRPGLALPWLVPATLLGAAAFLGLGLLLGGTLRAEAVLGVANLLWLVLVALGGVILPLTAGPEWLRLVGELTPAGALSQAFRQVLQEGAPPSAGQLVILAAWTALGWSAAVRWFRWQ